MRTGARIRISLALAALWLTAWGADPAHAGPSDACRDLAARFANSAEQFSLGSLASLIACVTAEIQDRAGGAENPPPPAPQQDTSPPPAPEPQAANPASAGVGLMAATRTLDLFPIRDIVLGLMTRPASAEQAGATRPQGGRRLPVSATSSTICSCLLVVAASETTS